ncbi:unnamed protein product, partial [marine sediment metagenome]
MRHLIHPLRRVTVAAVALSATALALTACGDSS